MVREMTTADVKKHLARFFRVAEVSYVMDKIIPVRYNPKFVVIDKVELLVIAERLDENLGIHIGCMNY
jgi:hypothetical protein